MLLTVEVNISKPKEDVWKVISNIKNSAEIISGIEKIEVLEKPNDGIEGLKWEETRTMFGKTAKETMWITDVKENESYVARAESHGTIYKSQLSVKQVGNSTQLTMIFECIPQSARTKLLSSVMGFLFKGSTRKALQQDLLDVKSYLEGI